MVQQNIDKRVTSCTHATQKRQSLLDNSQHSRVWRIVDQCLPASQITCQLGVPSAIASRLGSQHVLSTQHEQAYGSGPTPRTQSERLSAATMQIQLAGSLPVTLPESNNASLGSGYLSAPECRTMTSTDARTVGVALASVLALHNTATVPSRSYVPTVCRGCVTCGSSRAAQANICCWCFTDGPIVAATTGLSRHYF